MEVKKRNLAPPPPADVVFLQFSRLTSVIVYLSTDADTHAELCMSSLYIETMELSIIFQGSTSCVGK